jgi:hypothetical protein
LKRWGRIAVVVAVAIAALGIGWRLWKSLELGGGTPGKEHAVASSANAGTLSTVPAVPSLTATEKVVRKAASRRIPSVESIERRVEAACEQTEETGYRLGKRKDPTAKPPKLEKGALAK